MEEDIFKADVQTTFLQTRVIGVAWLVIVRGPRMHPPPPYRGYYPDMMYGTPVMNYQFPPEPKGKDFCFRCGQAGHFSKDCTQSAGNVCYRCGQGGHIARECSICFICKKTGHFARSCPEGRPQSPHRNY